MHPNPLFRNEDRDLHEALIEEIGFGMVFAATPDGLRVAHTPLVSTGDGAVQFHLSRGNALAKHLDVSDALIVINGADAYVSPRWYENAGEVPTWNYVALELEGRVRKMAPEGLEDLLRSIGERHEGRLGTEGGWLPEHVPADKWMKLRSGITGFELEVKAWRPTFKLSQNKSATDRARVAHALDANGSPAIASLMRTFAQ